MSSSPSSLRDLYVEELQDLWSANEQMKDVVDTMADAVSDSRLSSRLRESVSGIEKHMTLIKDLLDNLGEKTDKEHCRGMQGLVKEARKHGVDVKDRGAVRDVAIIAQYQRMCHYGLAGFGTAKAYAEALGRGQDAYKLDDAVEHIYQSDDYMSELAERTKNLEAA